MTDISISIGSAAARSEGVAASKSSPTEKLECFHCGTPCRSQVLCHDDKSFCCHGCLAVFQLLTDNGLTEFYRLGETAGVRVKTTTHADQFRFLDEPTVRGRLVDFSDAKLTRVTLHLPAIHCLACVWLLENLFRLKPGIGQSQVNFARKEVAIAFDTARVKLSDLVALLALLGYEPELKLSVLEAKPRNRTARRLWIQLALAGFAFGNIMLFSISAYLGLDAFAGPAFRKMVGGISLLLALPVVTFSALDYWRAAWTSLRQRLLNIDVPIAAGVAAIFAQSCYEVLSGRGEGYFDSLCGLIFFLLCGRLFQQKTYERLAFDRDYKSFFPLSVTRRSAPLMPATTKRSEEQVSLSQLRVGDRLIIRNGELIPADAKLVSGPALIDYSFVTGESEPIEKREGDYLYAGGRQMGGALEIETVKEVSQSYLTSLWNQDAFRKDRRDTLNALTNTYSQRFTKIIIVIALGSAVFWAFVNPAVSLKAFTSVLIVACPCALALAAPFALGTAQRVLSRRNVYLKNSYVLETLARVDSVVFDKTGTLTATGAGSIEWRGVPLKEAEERGIYSMTRHSTHPLAVRIGEGMKREHFPEMVRSFMETPGCGMEANVAGREIWIGSAAWLETRRVCLDGFQASTAKGSTVHVAIDGMYRGFFVLASAVRAEMAELVQALTSGCELALLSGDNEKEQQKFRALFQNNAQLRFNQSPQNKLEFIQVQQQRGRIVMMVGDGLNDAGALKQSDVGVAVVENVNAFSPASDVILAAEMVSRLAAVLRYAKQSVRVVRVAFWISAVYNAAGIAIAASGRLSPVVCAVLMPLSSATVVVFACGAAAWLGRKLAVNSKSVAATAMDVKRTTTLGESGSGNTVLLSRHEQIS